MKNRRKMKALSLIVYIYLTTDILLVHGQLELVKDLVNFKKVRRYYNILNNSCCSFEPSDCNGRRKRTAYPGVKQKEDDHDDELERFEYCLCDSQNTSSNCHLDFKLYPHRPRLYPQRHKKPDKGEERRIVFYWQEHIKEFECRLLLDTSVKCHFIKKTKIGFRLQDNVEMLVNYHTNERDECRKICNGISCVYESVEKADFFGEDLRHHYALCMNPHIVQNEPTTTTEPPIDTTPPPDVNIFIQDNKNVSSENNKMEGSPDVPGISGLVGGIVGGLLIALLLIVAVIFYVFRYKGNRLAATRTETVNRKHSVIQETLSENIYSVLQDPVYQDPESAHYNLATTIEDVDNNQTCSKSMSDPCYENLPVTPTAPEYNFYEQPVLSSVEDNKYDLLGAAPYSIGKTEFTDTNTIATKPIPASFVRLDSNGYTEPETETKNSVSYHTADPEYLEIQPDCYSLAKGVA